MLQGTRFQDKVLKPCKFVQEISEEVLESVQETSEEVLDFKARQLVSVGLTEQGAHIYVYVRPRDQSENSK